MHDFKTSTPDPYDMIFIKYKSLVNETRYTFGMMDSSGVVFGSVAGLWVIPKDQLISWCTESELNDIIKETDDDV